MEVLIREDAFPLSLSKFKIFMLSALAVLHVIECRAISGWVTQTLS